MTHFMMATVVSGMSSGTTTPFAKQLFYYVNYNPLQRGKNKLLMVYDGWAGQRKVRIRFRAKAVASVYWETGTLVDYVLRL